MLFTVLFLAGAGYTQSFMPSYYPFAADYKAVQVDLNGDGIPDLIALTSSGITELLSNGAGGFTTQTVTGPSGYPIATGDFNVDGKADVIFMNNFQIGYGAGNGSFSSFKTIAWSITPNDVVAQVADFNGDGKPDLAIAFDTSEAGQPSTFQVAVFINNGNGFNNPITVFQRVVPNGANIGFEYTTPINLVLGDFDSDGHADLVLRTTESDPINPGTAVVILTALFGNGDGTFSASTIDTTSDLTQIAAADMNNDGTTDIVADYFATAIYYGHSGRTFTRVNLTSAGDTETTPMLADFNGGGRKDIVYSSFPPDNSGTIGVRTLLQTSSGAFRQLGFEAIDTYYGGHGIVPFLQALVGDYNRDGKPDVALLAGDEIQHPQSADILLNARPRPDGSCQTPAAPAGIHVCSPVANSQVTSPVKFSFSATSFYPIRKMEIWIDGVKRKEAYEVFADEGFSDVNLTLSSGSHHVALFAGGFDGSVQKVSYDISVQ